MDKNFYITTPIYYPSAKPHMGHAYSSIIADLFARFKKIQGFNVYFLRILYQSHQKSKIFTFYTKFINKINYTNKFNLDYESLFMEFKLKVLNG